MAYLGTKPQIATTLADNIVTADKIVAGAVTDAKIAAMAASKLTGQVSDANAPSGSVIQVVQATTTTQTSTSTKNTIIDTALTCSITPSSTSSKVLVMVHLPFILLMSGGGYVGFYIKRNSTLIYTPSNDGNGAFNYGLNGVSQFDDAFAISFLDSPSSTSAVNYTVSLNLYNLGESTVQAPYVLGGAVQTAVITLMEIAG